MIGQFKSSIIYYNKIWNKNMADKKKTTVKVIKYKAVNPEEYKTSFNRTYPFYYELSNGDSVELDSNDVLIKSMINNKILKEV